MLDHSGWYGVLPRGITPSDIDFVFDANGRLLLGELKSKVANWDNVPAGQRRLYQAFAMLGCVCVVARHETPEGKQIDTLRDVVAFQVMRKNEAGNLSIGSVIGGNAAWQEFVLRHFGSP